MNLPYAHGTVCNGAEVTERDRVLRGEDGGHRESRVGSRGAATRTARSEQRSPTPRRDR
jgi:hypothetical protein